MRTIISKNGKQPASLPAGCFFIVMGLYILIVSAFWGGVVWAAIHFARKLW